MHRTIGDSYGTSGGKRVFRQENLPSYAATQVTFDSMNAVQEEIANAITGAGVALNGPTESVAAMTQLDTILKARDTAEANTRNANDRVLNGNLVRDQVNSVNNDVGDPLLVENIRSFGRTLQGFWIARVAANRINVNPGIALSTGGAQIIRHTSSSFRKDLDAVWAAGDLSGGRASTIALTDATWYHLFIIKKADGTVDAGYDTNLNASALLADSGYAYYRRIASVYWVDVANKIQPFVHDVGSDYFMWEFAVNEWNSSIAGPPTITTVPLAKSVPLGLALPAVCSFRASYTGTSWVVSVWDGILGGVTRGGASRYLDGTTGVTDAKTYQLTTDITQNVYAEPRPPTGGVTGFNLNVHGYYDSRWSV
jgi:hypothetical protein